MQQLVMEAPRPLDIFARLLKLLAAYRQVFILLSLVTCFTISIFSRVLTSDLRFLVKAYKETGGTFDAYTGNQDTIKYHFYVNGSVYRGIHDTGSRSVSTIQAGEPFTVYYYPKNPNINRISNPIEVWNYNSVGLTILIALLLVCLTFAVLPQMLIRDSIGVKKGY